MTGGVVADVWGGRTVGAATRSDARVVRRVATGVRPEAEAEAGAEAEAEAEAVDAGEGVRATRPCIVLGKVGLRNEIMMSKGGKVGKVGAKRCLDAEEGLRSDFLPRMMEDERRSRDLYRNPTRVARYHHKYFSVFVGLGGKR